jgi:hypothetical protein
MDYKKFKEKNEMALTLIAKLCKSEASKNSFKDVETSVNLLYGKSDLLPKEFENSKEYIMGVLSGIDFLMAGVFTFNGLVGDDGEFNPNANEGTKLTSILIGLPAILISKKLIERIEEIENDPSSWPTEVPDTVLG